MYLINEQEKRSSPHHTNTPSAKPSATIPCTSPEPIQRLTRYLESCIRAELTSTFGRNPPHGHGSAMRASRSSSWPDPNLYIRKNGSEPHIHLTISKSAAHANESHGGHATHMSSTTFNVVALVAIIPSDGALVKRTPQPGSQEVLPLLLLAARLFESSNIWRLKGLLDSKTAESHAEVKHG